MCSDEIDDKPKMVNQEVNLKRIEKFNFHFRTKIDKEQFTQINLINRLGLFP